MRFDLEAPVGPLAGGEHPLDLMELPGLATAQVGAPLRLLLADIDEDPNQPREAFDPDALAELAQTIAQRGVRQPVSVRPHPDRPGRWLLNMGARRLRASALAGKTDIPAFVDETADSYDQVIENEQRENLRPIELALFVERRMAAGESQAEIARRLGKSRSYVTFASALIDAPDWLMVLYRAGRCRGIRELYELRRLSAIHPERVSAWLQGRNFVSRGDVLSLREGLGLSPVVDPSTTDPVLAAHAGVGKKAALRQPVVASAVHESAQEARGRAPLPIPETSPRKAPAKLVADLEGAPVRVWLDAAPESAGHVFVTPMREGGESGARTAVTIEALRALRLVHR